MVPVPLSASCSSYVPLLRKKEKKKEKSCRNRRPPPRLSVCTSPDDRVVPAPHTTPRASLCWASAAGALSGRVRPALSEKEAFSSDPRKGRACCDHVGGSLSRVETRNDRFPRPDRPLVCAALAGYPLGVPAHLSAFSSTAARASPLPSSGREHAARSVLVGALGLVSRGGGRRGTARCGALSPFPPPLPPPAGRRGMRERKGGSLAVSWETAHRPPLCAPCLPRRVRLLPCGPVSAAPVTRTRRACRVRVLLVLCRRGGSRLAPSEPRQRSHGGRMTTGDLSLLGIGGSGSGGSWPLSRVCRPFGERRSVASCARCWTSPAPAPARGSEAARW